MSMNIKTKTNEQTIFLVHIYIQLEQKNSLDVISKSNSNVEKAKIILLVVTSHIVIKIS